MPLTELLPLAVFLVSYALDPRKFRTALYLLGAVLWGLGVSVTAAVGSLAVAGELPPVVFLLVVIVLVLATVVGLAVFLLVSGVTLLRKEGFGVSRLLGIGVGLVLLAYVAGVVAVVVTNSLVGFVWLLLLGLPAAYLGFAFVAFLLYGSLYPALMARRGAPVDAVVVLGSGLIGGQVPPLLAGRLRRGRQVFDRLTARGVPPRAMVTSGGQGPDEPVAEATAMASFLVADGLPADRVLTEDRSRNTEENLANTATVLAERGITGPIAVVTSDFHAFRAALLMRRHGMEGYAVGAPTARYYWPPAVIREFIAVLRDHLWLNAVLLVASLLPLLFTVAGMLGQR
ncbi:MAG: YdcF family protein [Propionicimonas sp.]|uniref:YdcF family protein n=1 Tax=Propionicimonas sp. TaxID=1955623 RepID=UPI003D0C2869